MNAYLRSIVVAAAGVLLVACGEKEKLSPAARAEATEIFGSRCATCHGPLGTGDGPASHGLTPPPRNLRDKSWQGTVDDQYIEKIIKLGGTGVGKSPVMPPNPDLMAKDEVVKALRAHVRSLSN